jgi:hypothetical protein
VSDIPPSLNRPTVDYDDFVEFVDLDGACELFDLSESVGVKPFGDENVWYGRDLATRGDEVLYRTDEGRWVLVFVILPSYQDDPGPHPLNRELTAVQAARWLRLNRHGLPKGLRSASLGDEDERAAGQARLDRDWTPSKASPPEGRSQEGLAQQVNILPQPSTLNVSASRGEPASSPIPIEPKKTRGKLLHHAVALLLEHPDWTNKQLAANLGCNAKSLSRFDRLKEMRRAMAAGRQDRPRGWKDGRTGHVEGWDDE